MGAVGVGNVVAEVVGVDTGNVVADVTELDVAVGIFLVNAAGRLIDVDTGAESRVTMTA